MAFEIGDLVWAKMKGFASWPAQVIEPLSTLKVPQSKKAHQFVLFFGTNDCAWIPNENISLHNESILDTLSKKKSKSYQHAIDEFLKHLETQAVEKQPSKITKKIKSEKKSTKVIKVAQSVSKEHEKNILLHKSPIKKITKRRGIDDHNKKSSSKFPSKSRKVNALDNLYKKFKASDKAESNRYSIERVRSFENLPGCSSVLDDKQLDYSNAVELSDEDSEIDFDKKYGFIGLQEFGRSILKKFIERGMAITLWHEDADQCTEFTETNNVKVANSPAQLIIDCDITFCCCDTSTEAFENIIFGEQGILEGFEETERLKQKYKGYVGLSSIDCETSKKINEAITIKNGYYLEAPIVITTESTNDGELIVLASGNRNLFTSCEKCFKVVASKVLFLSYEIGASSKMSVMLNIVSGTIFAAMSEAMTLSDRLNLKKSDVHKIFQSVFLGNTLEKKVRKMSEQDYSRLIPLKHVQKDINFGLNLANGISQSMPVTSAANEVLKHARLLKYSDYDISYIHKVVKQF